MEELGSAEKQKIYPPLCVTLAIRLAIFPMIALTPKTLQILKLEEEAEVVEVVEVVGEAEEETEDEVAAKQLTQHLKLVLFVKKLVTFPMIALKLMMNK